MVIANEDDDSVVVDAETVDVSVVHEDLQLADAVLNPLCVGLQSALAEGCLLDRTFDNSHGSHLNAKLLWYVWLHIIIMMQVAPTTCTPSST